MPIIDDSFAKGSSIEIYKPFGKRKITHAIHDIDGTHSLIRDWPPVMSLSMYWGMTSGLTQDFDSDENFRKLIPRVGAEPLPETDEITRFFNGYSAITQIEYGIRRGFQLGNYPKDTLALSEEDLLANDAVLNRLRAGQERYADIHERQEVHDFINGLTPRFFQLYEKLLNEACRDKNTAEAWVNPAKWRVPGGLEFMKHLHSVGVVNYFVTGAVVFEGGGMFEEVQACGYEVGPGKTAEALYGSSWDKKMPKGEVIADLFQSHGISPETTLIIGDGRTEIMAGAEMGCVCLSRVSGVEENQRKLHVQLGTHMMVQDYTDPALLKMIYAE